MKFILLFLERNKSFLVFLFLFLLSFMLIIRANSYQRSKYINSANFISGSLFDMQSKVASYFSLSFQNELLTQENMQLRAQLLHLKSVKLNDWLREHSLVEFSGSQYKVRRAEVVRNNYHFSKNYILIGKGEQDSLRTDMGVVSSQGIVGIVDKTTKGYALVQSVLNKSSQISVALKRTGHFGTLSWNTLAPDLVQLTDISSTVEVHRGDTIVTTGYSSIFPKGILVGAVENIAKNERNNSLLIDVKLFTDMTNIQYLYIIENTQQSSIGALEMK